MEDWRSLEQTLAAACGNPDELTARRAVRAADLACRSMKCVAAISDEWHDRLNDLRYRLGDIAAA